MIDETEKQRIPIAPEYHAANHRLFSPAPRHAAALLSFQHAFEANEPLLRAAFARIEIDYRNGCTAQQACDEQMSRVRSRPDLAWEPGEIEALAPHEEETLRVAAAMEAAAEVILRTLDDLLSSVVVAFNGKEIPLDAGPALAGGVSVYRTLEAVGNYIRHRAEWRITYSEQKLLKRPQLALVRPLARAISGRPELDGTRAYEVLLRERSPMLRILDTLSGYDAERRAGSFELLKRNVCAAATAIIDQLWQAWWDKRH